MKKQQNIQVYMLSIIRKPDLSEEESALIQSACVAATGNPLIVADSFKHLDDILKDAPGKEFVIFSNFARSSRMHQHESYPRDSYEYTAIQFQNICMNYPVKAIHIISEAYEFVIHMELVDLLTRNPPQITYKNAKKFRRANNPANRAEYIAGKINEL